MQLLKSGLFVFLLAGAASIARAQQVYTINADSTKLTGCDSNELIIENHTQNIPGFLFNTGKGRTIFKRGVVKLNDSSYIIGGDTLKSNAWLQGGNRFGALGVLGTLDNNSFDLYTNNTQRMRFTNTGRLLVGTTTDNNREMVQLNGSMYTSSYISNFLAPSGTNSGALRLRWGSGDGVYIGFYKQATTDRRAFISSPADAGSLWIFDSVGISFYKTPRVLVGGETTTGDAKLSVIRPYTETRDIFLAGRNFSTGTTANDFMVKTNGHVVAGDVDSGAFKFQVRGMSYFSDSVYMAGGTRLNVGGIYLVDNLSGRFISTFTSQPLTVTSGAGGSAIFNGTTKLASASNVIFSPGGSTNNAFILSAVTTNPSSTTMTFGNVRNDGPKKAIINTADFSSAGVSSVPVDLYIYPGKETGSNTQGNMILSYDGSGARGNIGIGTSSPSTQLHTTGGVRFAGLTQDSTQTRVIVSDANGNLYYRSAASLAANDILRSSLAVNGTITAKELRLTRQGWADYVFDSTYKLMGLPQLEGYVRTYQHLPGVPSATEVARDGISVGETQTVLLKKIEELTLYTIGQDKKIAAQQNELKSMKEELSALKKLILEKSAK